MFQLPHPRLHQPPQAQGSGQCVCRCSQWSIRVSEIARQTWESLIPILFFPHSSCPNLRNKSYHKDIHHVNSPSINDPNANPQFPAPKHGAQLSIPPENRAWVNLPQSIAHPPPPLPFSLHVLPSPKPALTPTPPLDPLPRRPHRILHLSPRPNLRRHRHLRRPPQQTLRPRDWRRQSKGSPRRAGQHRLRWYIPPLPSPSLPFRPSLPQNPH